MKLREQLTTPLHQIAMDAPHIPLDMLKAKLKEVRILAQVLSAIVDEKGKIKSEMKEEIKSEEQSSYDDENDDESDLTAARSSK